MDIREELAASKDRTKVYSAVRSKSVAHKPKGNYTKQSVKRILQRNELKGNDDEEGESDESSEGEESEVDKESESDEEANEVDERSEGESDEESESEDEANEDDESEEESRKVKKESSESDRDSKEYRGKKRVKKNNNVPKTKKRKRVSESDSLCEEEEVLKHKKSLKKAIVVSKAKKERVLKSEGKDSKPKKVLKKEKVEKKVSKPKEVLKEKPKKEIKKERVLKKKPLSRDQIKRNAYLSDFPVLLSRTVPSSLFSTIRDAKVDMRSFLADIGFSSLYSVSIDTLPSRMARFVVSNFNKETYELVLEKGKILVTREKIHEILGVPLGENSLFGLPERPLDDDFVKLWLKQFPKKFKDIRASDIAEKLVVAKQVDYMFKVNFLMLFANVMGKSDTMKAIVNLTVVRRISEDTNIAKIDWCGFIYHCLQFSELPNTPTGYYIGPLCFLILLYFDSTKFERYPVIRYRPAIQNWSTTSMNLRQKLEIEEEVIGKLELRREWSESEVHRTEGFHDGRVNVSQARTSCVPPTDKQNFCKLIKEKLSSISREKVELEDLLRKANSEFPNDEDVFELYQKYVGVFKEIVWLEDVHVDDFHPGDDENDDGSGKDVVGDHVDGENVDAAAGKDVGGDHVDGENVDGAGKDGCGDHVDGEKVQEAVAFEIVPENEEEAPLLSEETYTQWIEANIDWLGDVIDCICDAYYDDDLFNWPRVVQPLNNECPRTPNRVVTRSSPKKRTVKPSAYLSSPYMNKPTKVIAILKRVEFELGNSLFSMQGDKMETVFQTRSGNHEVSAVRLNMETLAPRLWIDANVLDCWAAILNYEESAKKDTSPKRHFFPTGCITDAMVLGRINEDEQWKIFSAEISAHFKNVNASKSLAEIELAFFPICVSGHFYVVVFNLKKSVTSMIILDNSPQLYVAKYKGACELLKMFFSRFLLQHQHPKHNAVLNVRGRIPNLKWKTKDNHADCGVFAMIHMECYVGEPAAKWDVGLCPESEKQVSLLMRMRFKIATKILLHELNVHSEKMFDLAYKFQTEIPEQTRISIIVNAIKNRADREKQKDDVENKEVPKLMVKKKMALKK